MSLPHVEQSGYKEHDNILQTLSQETQRNVTGQWRLYSHADSLRALHRHIPAFPGPGNWRSRSSQQTGHNAEICMHKVSNTRGVGSEDLQSLSEPAAVNQESTAFWELRGRFISRRTSCWLLSPGSGVLERCSANDEPGGGGGGEPGGEQRGACNLLEQNRSCAQLSVARERERAVLLICAGCSLGESNPPRLKGPTFTHFQCFSRSRYPSEDICVGLSTEKQSLSREFFLAAVALGLL